jgi:hypothetical protein
MPGLLDLVQKEPARRQAPDANPWASNMRRSACMSTTPRSRRRSPRSDPAEPSRRHGRTSPAAAGVSTVDTLSADQPASGPVPA